MKIEYVYSGTTPSLSMTQPQSMKARLLSLITHAYSEFKPSEYLDQYVNSLGNIQCNNPIHQNKLLTSLGLMLVRIDESDYIYEQEANTPGVIVLHKAWMEIVEEYHLVPSGKDPNMSIKKLFAEKPALSYAVSTCIDTYLSNVKVDTRILLKAHLHQTIVELKGKYVLANAAVVAALVAAITVWVNMPQYRLEFHDELIHVYGAYMKLVAHHKAGSTNC